eukprot:scaffold210391_cov32-Tisochrysis_lutea.AAC.1
MARQVCGAAGKAGCECVGLRYGRARLTWFSATVTSSVRRASVMVPHASNMVLMTARRSCGIASHKVGQQGSELRERNLTPERRTHYGSVRCDYACVPSPRPPSSLRGRPRAWHMSPSSPGKSEDTEEPSQP